MLQSDKRSVGQMESNECGKTIIGNNNNKKKKWPKTLAKADSSNCVIVNAKNVLWVCPLAMKKEEECIYCKCHNCFANSTLFSSKNRVTRGGRSNNRRKSIDDKALNLTCGHSDHTLHAWTDSLFFTKQYKMRNEREKNSHFPVKCSECGGNLVDKI